MTGADRATPASGTHLRLAARIAFCAAAAFVAWVSLLPGTALPDTHVSDKVEHVVAYLGLGLLGALGWRTRRAALCAGLVLFGIGIEILQGYVPGRSMDALDAVADAAGVLVGVGGAMLLRRPHRR